MAGRLVGKPGDYVAAVDIGTTNIRCHLYDRNSTIRGRGFRKVNCFPNAQFGLFSCQIELIYPGAGYVEMSPDVLWEQLVAVVKEAIKSNLRSFGGFLLLWYFIRLRVQSFRCCMYWHMHTKEYIYYLG